jgi:sugar-specific transcriptional regulator TrmB
MQSKFLKELVALGLSDKAAKVYLASLEIGSATAQNLAKKAGVNRPTTYVMIDWLTDNGLMSSFEKGKKRYFVAENPEQLGHLISTQKKEVEEKEVVAKRILNDLKSLSVFSKDRPNVQFYEGDEGTHALREEVLRSGEKELLEIVPLDLVRKFVPEDAHPEDLRHAIRKKLRIKSVYSTTRGSIYPEKSGNSESRFLAPENFGHDCEVIIFGDRVAMFTFGGKPVGFMVHSKEISQMMRIFFKKLWDEAGVKQKNR